MEARKATCSSAGMWNRSMMDQTEWSGVLDEWTELAAAFLRAKQRIPNDIIVHEFLAAGTVRRPPAEPESVTACEARIGRKLPASYTSFLTVSNGANLVFVGGSIELAPVERIGWFRDVDPQVCSVWSRDQPPMLDSEYLRYDDSGDPVKFRGEYVPLSLCVSSLRWPDLFLLNPEVRDSDGEWEAWAMFPQLPGLIRRPSFATLLLRFFHRLESAVAA